LLLETIEEEERTMRAGSNLRCVPILRVRRLLPVAVAAALVLIPVRLPAQECGVWTSLPGASTSLLGVTYGGGRFVAVGTKGVEVSADGAAWTPVPLALGFDALVRVAWNGLLYVAVGDRGRVYTSPDALEWTLRTTPTQLDLAGLAAGGGVWVAVGERETVLRSTDGLDWDEVHLESNGYLTSVTWTGSKFVAVGQGGTVLVSSDGLDWGRAAVPGADWLTDVIWANGQLIAVAFDGTVVTSVDGGQWTPRAETGRALRRLLWTGGRLIAAGDENGILSGPDPTIWETDTVTGAPAIGSITGLAWSGSVAVAVAFSGGVFTSACGIFATFSFVPPDPEVGETVSFVASLAQTIGRVRWSFGEVGCDGGPATRELACFGQPCTFPIDFAFATAGTKTVRLYGWGGEVDDEGERVFVLLRTRAVTVASTGACTTCVPPGPPDGPTPADLATLPGGAVMLQWNEPSLGTPPFTYDVVLDGETVCVGTAVRQCLVSDVAESSELHSWYVVARNFCGESALQLWRFRACGVAARPDAVFAWSPYGPLPGWPLQAQPFIGQEITLLDQSTGSPGEWAWAGLVPGGLLGDQNPTATWWAPGDREVGLQAANCQGWSAQTVETVTVYDDVRPRRLAFDFGSSTSPVAEGFTRVTPSAGYSGAAGYGWLTGAVTGRERAAGDALVRDFHFTVNATFAVDLPARVYDVTLWMGDSGYAHDEMAVYLEGELRDVVTAPAGTIVARTYRVAVGDGQLTVRLHDQGGADPNAVINGLAVVAGDPLRVDFGTANSPVAAGHRRASELTTFDAPAWCGWAIGRVASRDRGAGDDLVRDLAVTQDATFSCALGHGVWDVVVTMGDHAARHDEMGVYLEGTLVGTVSRQARQFGSERFRARVFDGELSLRLVDLGGTDVNTVINGLTADRVGPFDFGTATSPVAAGHTRVANSTRYGAAPGFGWLEGAVGGRDRGVGSDLARDLNTTTGATFVVDVPDGAYDVTVTVGDTASAHDLMALLLEDQQVALVTTARGKTFAGTFRTVVADGQLTLRVEDVGGSDLNAVINGLALAPAGP